MAEPPGARVLVTGAGSGAANNLIRDLRAGDPTLAVIGCHDDPFVLRKSVARRNWLVCATGHPGFAASLRRVVQRERIDVVLPTTDLHVWALSRLAPRFPCRLFLPPRRVLALCRDKLALARHLRARGVPAPETHPVRSSRALSAIFRRFGRRPLWCRLRAGSGSAAAIPVRRPEHARSWIAYWSEVRGARPGAFTLAEYLPGRDFF